MRLAAALLVVPAACRGAPSSGPGSTSTAIPTAISTDSTPTPTSISTYRARPVTDGHAVEVRLVYSGKPHAPWPIAPAFASHCGGATEVADPSLDVDARGGVTGAVAWIDDIHEGERPDSGDAVLNQKDRKSVV